MLWGAVEMACRVKTSSTESDNPSLILGIHVVKEKLYSGFHMFTVAHLHEYTHTVGEEISVKKLDLGLHFDFRFYHDHFAKKEPEVLNQLLDQCIK